MKTIKNDAMFVQTDKLNTFTKQLAVRCKENPVWVVCRNGSKSLIEYDGERFFLSSDKNTVWNLDGSHPVTKDYDIIEFDIEEFAALREQGITDRASFLKKFPDFEEWLEQGEKIYGNFHGINSITFTDKRTAIVYKFEQVYRIEFHNPANADEELNASLTLSYEAMEAFLTLYRVLSTDEETRRFWKWIGVPPQEIEAHLGE